MAIDNRIPLKSGSILFLDKLQCHIGKIRGRGSNAIVYEGWYPDSLNPDRRHRVLIKELYPFHPQGKISREKDGHLLINTEAKEFYEVHRRSFKTGNDIHLRLLHDHPDFVGVNLNSYEANNTLYSLLGYTGGRSLQEEFTCNPADLRTCVKRMLNILNALEAFHKSGYLHLDINPDNIMLVGKGKQEYIFLIDYDNVRSMKEKKYEPLRCKPGYSAPEVELNNMETLGYSSDLYSVAAIFFRSIMGREISLEERIQRRPPDGEGSPLLEDALPTVTNLARKILRKGLNLLVVKRYQDIDAMRHDFQELLDRIDCVGITHWALWDSGRESAEQLIRINPSFHYVKEADTLYPVRVQKDNTVCMLSDYMEQLTGTKGRSGLLVARGGMGKTTLLLMLALKKDEKYMPEKTAVFYISLSGWNPGEKDYIIRQILSNLKFKPGISTYENALYTLEQLLKKPIETKEGEKPVLLLLLDSLNEIHGDISPLLKEINDLKRFAGIRILAASRCEIPQLRLETVKLAELFPEDVKTVLEKNDLTMPDSVNMSELLRIPLVLTIFLKIFKKGEQMEVENEDDLIRAYLNSLYEKEVSELSLNSPERWQIDAAFQFILPLLAVKGGSMTDIEMLKIVRKCWILLKSGMILRIFPQWIGYSREILGNAKTAEEWLGLMVHKTLWSRLGLLIKNSHGEYQILHQNIGESLKSSGILLKHRIRRIGISYVGIAGVLGSLFIGVIIVLS